MMLRSVEFRTEGENPYPIQLVRPNPQGFRINEVRGLGAGQADLHLSGRATMDGDVLNGARLGSRNIVLDMGFGRDQDPEDGRIDSYDYFPLKERVEMIFDTDRKRVIIAGTVESNEPEIFTDEPGFNVSIMCEPYFKSLEEDRTITRLYNLEKKLEFPLSNESLTDPLIIMGEHVDNRYIDLPYRGNIQNGVLIRFIFNGRVTNPSILAERKSQAMRLDTAKIQSMTGAVPNIGDIIEIDTVRGRRKVTLIRNGRRSNILNALSTGSQWIELFKGINPISIFADSNVAGLQVEIHHDTLYSGL